MIPIVPEEVFEFNPEYQTSFDGEVLIIDNWYKNPEKICSLLENIPAPRWKSGPNSRNWIDYYDCRPTIQSFFYSKKIYEPFQELMMNINKHFFKDNYKNIKMQSDFFHFNAYKNIKKNVPNNFQFFPHQDYEFNCVVYLDKICSGGTAIYPDMDNIPNNEHENVLYDVSKFSKIIIPSKFNRAVIFKGEKFHGGYIENHNDYLNDWRINHVMFFDSI
jgi:hypothetical protein